MYYMQASAKYCPHILADYIILVATSVSGQALSLMGLADRIHGGTGAPAQCSPEVRDALRQGAFAVFEACGPDGMQYLYSCLGGRAGGQQMRAALAELKADFEKNYRYTGKV